MWINWKRLTSGAFLLASLALLLSGCGDLGGSQSAQGVAATKTISGIVSDPDTGLPMASAQVTAYAVSSSGVKSDTPLSVNPTSTTSDPRGRYQLRIPASYAGSVIVEADVASGSVVRQLVRMLASGSTSRIISAAVPQTAIAGATVPPVMISFATNTVVEFVRQNNSSAGFSSDNIRKATVALETFFGPNFTQTPPPTGASDAGTSKAQQDLIVSITAINAVLAHDSNTNIATIVSALTSSTGLGPIADAIKSNIVQAATTLAAQGTVPAEYVPSPEINTAISNVQTAPVVIPALTDTVPPSTPTGLAVQGSVAPKRVALTWSASTDSGAGSTGVTGYLVCRADSSDSSEAFAAVGTVPVLDTAQSTFTFVDVTAVPQSRYSYKVIAYDAAQNYSEGSTPVSVVTPAPVDSISPAAPAGLSLKVVTDSQVTLQWQQSTKTLGDGTVVPATSYYVFRNSEFLTTVSQTIFTDDSVQSGTSYSYFVKAADADGNLSPASLPFTVTTKVAAGAAVPDAPSGALTLAAPAAYNKVQLAWGASPTANVTYNVYRDAALIASGISVLSYSDASAIPNAVSVYSVSAVSAQGAESTKVTLSVTTPMNTGAGNTAPSAPSNLVANAAASNSVSLSWTKSTGDVAGYEIWRGNGAGQGFGKIATVVLPGYTDTTVSAATSYSYVVRAFSSAGVHSDYSAGWAVTTLAPVDLSDKEAPAVPADLAISGAPTAAAVSVSWSACTDNVGVTGYFVYRNGQQVADVKSGTSYADTSVAPAVSYSYTVAAYDNAGNVSPASAALSVSTPAAVANSYAISGKVTLNGAGLSGVTVSYAADGGTPVIAQTDGNGNYSFINVPNGTYTISVAAAGYYIFTPTTRTAFVQGGKVIGQDFGAVLSGSVAVGATFPDGTIIGGISYPSGAVIGGVTYPTATVLGGVTYPTGTVIGGILYPSGVVIGGVSYPAGTIVGGIAFPLGAVTTGVVYPTGTVMGGVIYPTGSVGGSATYPSGVIVGNTVYPAGVVSAGTIYPGGTIVGGITYPSGSVIGGVTYPSATVFGGVTYPTGTVSGGTLYPSGVVVGGVSYPAGTVVGGVAFPLGALSVTLGYPSGSITGALIF